MLRKVGPEMAKYRYEDEDVPKDEEERGRD